MGASSETDRVIELPYRVRFITAASLFDGHDASINIMRRILQASGAEVIHLGHNRSAEEIVRAALEEDAQAIAISSYQGGHVEYFRYVVDLLKAADASHIRVFGGGGGTITPEESRDLEKYGVAKIYSPEDGRLLGLQGIIKDMMGKASFAPGEHLRWKKLGEFGKSYRSLAEALTCVELGAEAFQGKSGWSDFTKLQQSVRESPKKGTVVGITGTGGAGKSSLTDELVSRLLSHDEKVKVAILAVDPTRRKTGGALLGDRLRFNSLKSPRCYMRSLATRTANTSLSLASEEALKWLRAAGFDWIFLESSGTGQADTAMVGLTDLLLYVMTSEFGAPTQLEKINMLDYADAVVVNKMEKQGSLDALNDVRKQFRRNHREFEKVDPTQYPVFGTVASRFNDPGVNHLFEHPRD